MQSYMYVIREDGLTPLSDWTQNQMFYNLNYNLVILPHKRGKLLQLLPLQK